MGIHQALIAGYAATASTNTWSLVGTDSTNGFQGATVSVANCQAGDQAWFGAVLDAGGGFPQVPIGYTTVTSSATNRPDYLLAKRTITSSGTETADVGFSEDNAILLVFRSSTGSIVNDDANGDAVYATRTSSFGAPTTPTANFSNRVAQANSIALNVGFLDDDNPSSITAPTGYTFAVAGNIDDGSSSSSIFAAYAETTSASSTPPGAGNAWGISGDSDENNCSIVYLQHGSQAVNPS